MSLYLKYRPKTIDELDLAAVRKILGEMVSSNKIAHAYLFTGPRGAGKTSSARILARIVNCEKNAEKLGEPCNECEACLSILNGSAVDVVEIDAASNRGIDDIRELKERIKLAPAILRRKVYIIDEVHMLTTEAFNALLKTLEEPPDHAVFILCTTESHKVPETIASRCVRVAFTKATKDEMKRSFARVVAGESAQIEDAALDAIAAAVDGSFRDGVKILDTVLALGGKVGISEVEMAIYGAAGFNSKLLTESLVNQDLNKALEQYHKAVAEGVDLVYLTVSVMKDLRTKIVETLNTGAVPLVYKLDDITRRISTSPVPEILIEMAIVEWCQGSSEKPKGAGSGSSSPVKQSRPEKTEVPAKTVPVRPSETVEKPIIKETHESEGQPEEDLAEPASPEIVEKMVDVSAEEAWRKLTANLSGESYSLGALLSKARPGVIKGNLLTIETTHEFHKEQLLQAKFRTRVEQLVSDVVGIPMRIDCVVVKGRPLPPQENLQNKPQVDSITEVAPEENELMEAAEEIFGN